MVRTLAIILMGMATSPANATCRDGPFVATNGASQLHGNVTGKGRPVLMIPSLGRGPDDYTNLAKRVVRAGFAVVRYEPRWFGRSDGPQDTTLSDLAEDAAAVLAEACGNAEATVIGHAFGNRVARALAYRHPHRISSVVLLAAGGQVPIKSEVNAAIAIAAAQGLRNDSERLPALQLAFFARGGDARQWLTGWSARAAQLQGLALAVTKSDDWKAAGSAPILIIQATEDPVAPVANARALVAKLGDRVRYVSLPKASHAILPEQPRAVSRVVNLWLRGERRTRLLQLSIDRSVAP